MYDAAERSTGGLVVRAESMTHMTTDTVEHAVEIFVAARRRRRRVPVLPAACRPVSLDDACLVQAALNERLGGALGGMCGRKIGCTTEVMQRYLQIEQPCAGALYADQVHDREAAVPFAELWRPGVECEIAVRLGRSLPASDAPFDRTAVARAVESCMAAIEIVDDRYEAFRALDAPSLIADDFFSAGAVLGTPVSRWRELDLRVLGAAMTINGVEVGSGRGADVMGHPFEALTWLANHAADSGRPLAAGEVVLTGSIVETRWVSPGDTVRVTVESLGEASVHFVP